MDRKGRGGKGVVRVLVGKAPGHLELVVKVRVRIYQAGTIMIHTKNFYRTGPKPIIQGKLLLSPMISLIIILTQTPSMRPSKFTKKSVAIILIQRNAKNS